PRGSRFLKKAFYQFGPQNMVDWLRERGVSLHTESDGRMFPDSDRSQTIIDCFLREAERYKVDIKMGSAVEKIATSQAGFILTIREGQTLLADAVCIASGGHPGAQAYQWIEALGHPIEPPIPSLFTFNLPGDPLIGLMGVSVPDVQVRIPSLKLEEQGPVLITHWGLSGPVVLRISAWGARRLAEHQWTFRAFVNWVPSYDENALLALFQSYRDDQPALFISGRNPFGLPGRLWAYFLQRCGITENVRWGELKAASRNALVKCCCSYELNVVGKTTFKEEFVTAGGVSLSAIHPETMESRKVPGLFFAGEVMDVDGITGGFNFQHAWTSAWIAAQTVAHRF
ncbi:MAG: hypothetical protein RL732_1451, partial [Bacteroidota bacterium]